MQIRTFSSLSAFVFLIGMVGCGSPLASQLKSDTQPDQQASTARTLIDRSSHAYRTATAYQDAGFVRLAYSLAGEQFEDRAPLAVSYQSPDQIRLHAYAVQLAGDGRRLQATVSDAQTNHFDGQCLSLPASKRLTLEEVYADPVIAQFAAAGMGGPAPQLELLLSADPLSAWLQAPAELSLGEADVIDRRQCKSVIISVEPLRYVLWIDERNYLIRRIELPWQVIAPSLAEDPRMSDASLTIELVDAAFRTRLPANHFAMQTPPLSMPVAALVTPPPPAPHRLVGSTLPKFTMQESTGRFDVSEQGSDREATVLMWIADHASSQQAATALQQVIDALPAKVQRRIRPAVVMAEPHPQGDTGRMLRRWGVGLPWIDDAQAVGRDVFQISEAPCLVVIGSEGRVEMYQQRLTDGLLQALPAILTEVSDRTPIGRLAIEQYIADQARYRRTIAQRSRMQFPLSSESILLTAESYQPSGLR